VNTFFRHLQLSTLCDLDWFGWLVARALWYILDLVNNLVTLKHFAKDDMAAIEPAEITSVCRITQTEYVSPRDHSCDEKL
jgi:hypothetical protein